MYSMKFALCCLQDAMWIAETWRRPQLVAGFTKEFRALFKFDGNVSNNFKYPYLIYWAIMFIFILYFFCHSWVGTDCAEICGEITFPI